MHKAQSETQKQCSPKSDHAIGGTATNPTPRRAFTTMKSLNIRLNLVNETDASMNLQGTTASKLERGLTPPAFSEAVESMHQANLRQGISLGTIRPPQRLAPFSHAIGLEVDHLDKENTPTDSEGDAFGRLILLHDPGAQESWEGEMRLVAYIQADMESAVATDPLLPDVAWQWLEEGLETHSAGYTNLEVPSLLQPQSALAKSVALLALTNSNCGHRGQRKTINLPIMWTPLQKCSPMSLVYHQKG